MLNGGFDLTDQVVVSGHLCFKKQTKIKLQVNSEIYY